MSTEYALFKHTQGHDQAEVEVYPSFRSAWHGAIDLFEGLGLAIVGCHLDDDPANPNAEFFVAGHGIHETYTVRPAASASEARTVQSFTEY